jgi:protein-S-isoprenylcysteine O-methyltransferase Ste14
MLETIAYYIALFMVVATLPAVCMWFLIHPFADFWRKQGPFITYLAVCVIVFPAMYGIYLVREPILRIHFGVQVPLFVLACILLVISIAIGIQLRRHLSITAMLDMPELSRQHPGRLLTEGIYARIRHPRYVEVGIGIAATAFFCNYLAGYVLLVLYFPVIYLVVLLEERELKNRFGKVYEEYSRRVPRFIPSMRKKMKSDSN